MTPALFTLLFLAVLVAHLAMECWLSIRHARHIRRHRGHVPTPFAATVTLAEHQKAADYTVARVKLGIHEIVIGAIVILAWTVGGGLDSLDRAWREMEFPGLATGTGFLISVFLLSAVIDLPFGAYRTFVIEQRFGFNRTTLRLFIADTIKGALLLLVLGGPLAALALWLMVVAGSLWWLYVWLTWTGFSLLMLWLVPIWIAPLFNRFESLTDQALAARIQNLLQRCGFKAAGIFVMDGSRRSAHGNAYFSGFGSSKQIVFFDTLLKALDGAEIEAVLAHELGHFRLAHIRKRLLFSMTFGLAGLWVLGYLASMPWFFQGLGMAQPSSHATLALFVLVAPLFTYPLRPLASWLSRRHEFEADGYAVRHSDGTTLARALIKLYRSNASTLTPDPLYSAWHDSHPPAPVRVAWLEALVARSQPRRGQA